MELRERYDPEDIESLLSERAFDELLDDERTFVLRHVSGRDEYERMRAMLHYVRPDERSREPIEADDAVRRNVMNVFRDQQQSQWRIWLNSVAVWLAPKEAAGFWRPALAFGSLALLIVAGVVAVRQFEGEGDNMEVAEVRPSPTPKASDTVLSARDGERETQKETLTPSFDVPPPTTTLEATNADLQKARSDVQNEEVPQERVFVDGSLAESKYAALREERTAVTDDAVTSPADQLSSPSGAATALTFSHVVTADELVRNQSLANEQGIVQAESASRKRSAGKEKDTNNSNSSRSLAQDPALLSLIAAGW